MEETGRKCTKCGRGAPDVWFYTRKNSYGKLYIRELCNECYAARRSSQNRAIRKTFGPGSIRALLKANRPPEGTPCGICGVPMTHDKTRTGMCFDHDHETDTFRGWLCKVCNTSLGGLGDNLKGLAKVVKYLSTYEIIN